MLALGGVDSVGGEDGERFLEATPVFGYSIHVEIVIG